MNESDLSPALTRRLPAYFRALIRLYGEGKERVSSEELSAELGLASSQVRSDMKALGCRGQRSYGYGIPPLYRRIADILQLSDRFNAVIIGASPLASAIAGTQIFSKRGIKLLCCFSDRDENCGGARSFTEFADFFASEHPHIVITAGSEKNAAETLETIENIVCGCDENGLTELWNFTDTELFSSVIKVKNIHFSDQLMLLTLEVGK